MANSTNFRIVWIALAGVLLASCTTTKLPENVDLVGEVYYIPTEGVEVNGRGDFRLKPGTYWFATNKPGHRLRIHEIEIENRRSRYVKVDAGPYFALAEFAFTPEADLVMIKDALSSDAVGTRLDPPWRIELDEGPYRVEAEAQGQLPLRAEFEIVNQPVFLDLQFEARPTSTPLLITTTPPGARLFVDGVAVGETPKKLQAVAFGEHRIEAYVYRDSGNRLAFEGDVPVDELSPPTLELALDVEQRRFEGEWYERAEAARLHARKTERERRAEERAYRSARTMSPFELRFSLPDLADKVETSEQDFAAALFMLLRVGDRVRVDLGGNRHLVWKRSPRLDAAFRQQVAALWNNEPRRLRYDDDPVDVVHITPEEERLITTVAYHLYRKANVCPILDLGGSMHELDRMAVHTLAEDGRITVLTFGGTDLAVNGRPIEAAGQFGFRRLDPATRTLDLTWGVKPRRILVVSERHDLASPVAGRALALNEKRLVDVGVGGRVEAFHRFTRHPDGTWRHYAIRQRGIPGGPLNVNYNVVSVGPHDVVGKYTREWLVHFVTPYGNMATRQIPMDYQVAAVIEPANPGEFIRRED